ncbi:MAG TPA: hypothetical protein VIE65_09325 [Methylobacter sp.]|jgi:hypothetical protein
MQKFVEITRKDKGFDKENSWFGFCQKEKIPFITIKARSKTATVQWDYITYPPGMDEALFSLHADIKAQITTIYQSYMSESTWLGVGPGVISFGHLEISAARDIALELFDVIHQTALAIAKTQEVQPCRPE